MKTTANPNLGAYALTLCILGSPAGERKRLYPNPDEALAYLSGRSELVGVISEDVFSISPDAYDDDDPVEEIGSDADLLAC